MNTCKAEDCDRTGRLTRGLCPKHYQRFRRGVEPQPVELPECSVSHCSNPATSRSGPYCAPHYQISYRGLDPESRKLRAKASGTTYYDVVCLIQGCTRRAESKFLCGTHYSQAKQGIDLPDVDREALGISLNPECDFETCPKRSRATKGGYCAGHASQLRLGAELQPIRVWGDYRDGKLECVIQGCEKVAEMALLCMTHHHKRKQYKLTIAELQGLIDIEGCQNPGCDNTERLCIDHDHTTGKVRDILCNGCNSALGFLGEDTKRAEGLIEYIKTHTVTPFSTEDVPEIMSNPRNP